MFESCEPAGDRLCASSWPCALRPAKALPWRPATSAKLRQRRDRDHQTAQAPAPGAYAIRDNRRACTGKNESHTALTFDSSCRFEFEITHPFHPGRGQRLQLAHMRVDGGEPWLWYVDREGNPRRVKQSFTDRAEPGRVSAPSSRSLCLSRSGSDEVGRRGGAPEAPRGDGKIIKIILSYFSR